MRQGYLLFDNVILLTMCCFYKTFKRIKDILKFILFSVPSATGFNLTF